jgi:hypothetical protein
MHCIASRGQIEFVTIHLKQGCAFCFYLARFPRYVVVGQRQRHKGNGIPSLNPLKTTIPRNIQSKLYSSTLRPRPRRSGSSWTFLWISYLFFIFWDVFSMRQFWICSGYSGSIQNLLSAATESRLLGQGVIANAHAALQFVNKARKSRVQDWVSPTRILPATHSSGTSTVTCQTSIIWHCPSEWRTCKQDMEWKIHSGWHLCLFSVSDHEAALRPNLGLLPISCYDELAWNSLCNSLCSFVSILWSDMLYRISIVYTYVTYMHITAYISSYDISYYDKNIIWSNTR